MKEFRVQSDIRKTYNSKHVYQIYRAYKYLNLIQSQNPHQCRQLKRFSKYIKSIHKIHLHQQVPTIKHHYLLTSRFYRTIRAARENYTQVDLRHKINYLHYRNLKNFVFQYFSLFHFPIPESLFKRIILNKTLENIDLNIITLRGLKQLSRAVNLERISLHTSLEYLITMHEAISSELLLRLPKIPEVILTLRIASSHYEFPDTIFTLLENVIELNFINNSTWTYIPLVNFLVTKSEFFSSKIRKLHYQDIRVSEKIEKTSLQSLGIFQGLEGLSLIFDSFDDDNIEIMGNLKFPTTVKTLVIMFPFFEPRFFRESEKTANFFQQVSSLTELSSFEFRIRIRNGSNLPKEEEEQLLENFLTSLVNSITRTIEKINILMESDNILFNSRKKLINFSEIFLEFEELRVLNLSLPLPNIGLKYKPKNCYFPKLKQISLKDGLSILELIGNSGLETLDTLIIFSQKTQIEDSVFLINLLKIIKSMKNLKEIRFCMNLSHSISDSKEAVIQALLDVFTSLQKLSIINISIKNLSKISKQILSKILPCFSPIMTKTISIELAGYLFFTSKNYLNFCSLT